MRYSPQEAKISLSIAENILKNDQDPPALRVEKLIGTLKILRARGLTNGLRRLIGNKVYAGPFKGMTLTEDAIAAYNAPVLLGCYEHELHPFFENAIAAGYARVLNIGCSIGYYAVGLACRMPEAIIEAFDISEEARTKCEAMVRANGAEDRVRVFAEFLGEDFEKYDDGKKTLVLMDIEGAESDLLDPAKYPALRKMDVLVEMHDLIDSTLSKKLCQKFESSHTIEVVKNRTSVPDVEKLLPEDYYLDPEDHILMGWECRGGRTPWGIFRVRT